MDDGVIGAGETDGAVLAAYDRATVDPAFLARFRAHYAGSADPLDALWWLRHPDRAAPSGRTLPGAPSADLRRAVFGPDADDAARAAYRSALASTERFRAPAREAVLHADAAPRTDLPRADVLTAAEAPDASPLPAAAHAPGRRRTVIVAALVAVLLTATALGLRGVSAPPSITGEPVAFTGSAGERAADRVAMSAWLQDDAQEYGPVYRAWTSARQLAPVRAADRHGFLLRRVTGSAVVPLSGADLSEAGVQTVAVVLTCSTRADVRWTLDAEGTGGGGASAVAEARTSACDRTPTIAVARVASGRALSALRIDAPKGVRSAFVVLSGAGTSERSFAD